VAEPLITNAADPQQLKDAQISEQDRLTLEAKDIVEVLNTPAGKRVFWRLLEDCHLFGTVFNHDPLEMARLAGQQEIAHTWRTRIDQAIPGAFLKLQQAVAIERTAQDRERRARRTASQES
jgi:hypothetical protein